MTVQFQDSRDTLSQTLTNTASSISGEQITLKQLLELIGEQGLLLFCMILVIPFLLPISIPGVSTVFGLVIILIGIGVTLNRLPWLPRRLMERAVATANLVEAMKKGAEMFARLDRVIRPRLLPLTDGAVINRINGLGLTLGGILLLFPLGLVPFSNTLPGIAVLFLAVGILQRDGLFIIAGHLMNVVTIIYFAALAIGALLAGQGLMSLIGAG
ncbi:MAG TPA: exopolysaccharide biosynthesis protein [Oceanobacillus sp.]|nr:exopolysaccharide biosynthesis protein [Oceanobacillus sp.]